MAISKTTTEGTGISVKDAYHRVEGVSIRKGGFMDVSVFSYVNSSAEEKPFSRVVLGAQYDQDGDNPFKQAYEAIKLSGMFSGGVDC